MCLRFDMCVNAGITTLQMLQYNKETNYFCCFLQFCIYIAYICIEIGEVSLQDHPQFTCPSLTLCLSVAPHHPISAYWNVGNQICQIPNEGIIQYWVQCLWNTVGLSGLWSVHHKCVPAVPLIEFSHMHPSHSHHNPISVFPTVTILFIRVKPLTMSSFTFHKSAVWRLRVWIKFLWWLGYNSLPLGDFFSCSHGSEDTAAIRSLHAYKMVLINCQ